MAAHWPIIFLGDAANELELAHRSGKGCLRWFRIGPLVFWDPLLINLGGPIAVEAAVLGGVTLAGYFSGRSRR